MRYMYDLDDVFCEDNAHAAVKQEIINILKESKSSSIDVVTLFEQARKKILNNISHNYYNNLYLGYNNFNSEHSISMDYNIKKIVNMYNICNDHIQRCNFILSDSYETLKIKREVKKILEDVYESKKEVDKLFENCMATLFAHLNNNSSIKSIVFHKLDSGKYRVDAWIKPYLDRITFNTLSIKNINIENYDFTGTKGINIHSRNIKDNTLSNVVLNGAIVKCYDNDSLYPIDPTKVNITGTDFTGSKGAIVTLENVDKVPENCNLTDAAIIVNSRDDIKRFNLDKYGKNVYIKQDSIISHDKVIDLDFNGYLNYTGTIGDIQMSSINDSLKLDGASDEEIRIENNKIISNYIASELASMIDFEILYRYFKIIIKTNGYDKDYQEILEERSQMLNSYDDKKTMFNIAKENLYALYKNIGNPFGYRCKYTNSDGKIKIFTSCGVFSIDLLRLGLSKEELELIDKGESEKLLELEVSEELSEFLGTIYNYVLKKEKEENESSKNDEEHLSLDNIVSIMISSLSSVLGKTIRFKDFFISSLENLIYNNLEEKNKGYSYAKKRINK